MIPSLEVLSKQIAKDLKGSRLQGKSSPDNPVTSQTMCTAYMALYKWEISEQDILSLKQFWEKDKIPIKEISGKYYYELDLDKQLDIPIFKDLKERLDLTQII
jgi:hypothetical protein